MRDPYLGDALCGLEYGALDLSDGDLRNATASFQVRGWHLLVHSNGAYDSILNHQPDPRGVLHRIEHFTVTQPERRAPGARRQP